MGLSAGWNIYNLSRPGIPGRRLGSRLLYLKNPKPPDFNPISSRKALPHCRKDAVHHLGCKVLLATRLGANCQGQFLLRRGRQGITSSGETEAN